MDKNIVEYLKSKSIVVIQEDIDTKLNVWEQWYKGHVDDFHSYSIYTGKRHLKRERKSLMMALMACQRWADLLLNEKVEINSENPEIEQKIKDLLTQTNFYVRGNNLIERSFALGEGFTVEYWDGKKTNIKYITQEFMYPITYDSGRLTEVAFSSRKVIDGQEYVYLETHLLDDNDEYVVDNTLLFTGKDYESGFGYNLIEVPNDFYEEHDIIQKWETHSKRPLFQVWRPNVANRDNFNSPFGTSVFSGAIDKLKTIDLIFDSLYKEFELGRKKLFVSEGVTTVNYDKDGKEIPVFDPADDVFYRLPDVGADGFMEEINPTLRVEEHEAALQTMLNLYSQDVGFGSNGFRWDGGNVTTATQIISENSEMFRTLKKHETLMRESIIEMVRGLLFIEHEFVDESVNTDVDITVNFDDSIIEDTSEIKRQALLDYNAGLIDAVQYYMDVYKMTEEQALQYRDKLRERNPQVIEEPEGT